MRHEKYCTIDRELSLTCMRTAMRKIYAFVSLYLSFSYLANDPTFDGFVSPFNSFITHGRVPANAPIHRWQNHDDEKE
jgi:hypothetical protein